jgi:formate hydrogenlyase subunit 6
VGTPDLSIQLSKDFLLASYDNKSDSFIPLKPEKIEEIKRQMEEQKKGKRDREEGERREKVII